MATKRGSWYGNFGAFHDTMDNNRPASGIPNTVPSIAIRRPTLSRGKKRQYYEITLPNGVREVVIHGDFGPSDPGRLDVNARAASDAGYSPGNFPTDKPVKYRYLGTRLPAGVQLGVQGKGPVAQAGAAAAPQTQAAALTPELAARRAAILESLISRRNPDSPLVQLGVISKALGGQAAATPAAAGPAQGTRPVTKHPEVDQGGTAVFEGVRVAASVKPVLEYARQKGWRGKVTSGWRSRAKQEYLYSHPQGYPVAKPGTSMHEQDKPGWGAVDVEQGSAPQLARILASSPYRDRFKWAGSKDRVHFSFQHGGRY